LTYHQVANRSWVGEVLAGNDRTAAVEEEVLSNTAVEEGVVGSRMAPEEKAGLVGSHHHTQAGVGNNFLEAADGIGVAAGRSGQNCNPDIPT
jgi:hypothetical protein